MPAELTNYIPTFVLVFFRLAGMMLFAPLFGSTRIPRRVKALLVLVLAMATTATFKTPVQLPDSLWAVTAGVPGEMIYGLAMGMVLGFVFVAAQWAGEMIGQQMGFNLSQVFDPQYGSQGSLIGDMYYMITLVVFLAFRGHHAMLKGVAASFEALPLMSVGLSYPLLDTLIGLFQGAAVLAIQLAAPMLVTMLVVDLVLGLIGRTVPQMNVMQAGLSVRAAFGMLVVIVGLVLTTDVLREAVADSMQVAYAAYTTPAEGPSPADGP
jgi:flagellar biosynthetic protein FliR